MVATKRTCGRKFLSQWLWHSLAKLCTKNYENPSISVKVTAKKSVAPFICVYRWYFRANPVSEVSQLFSATYGCGATGRQSCPIFGFWPILPYKSLKSYLQVISLQPRGYIAEWLRFLPRDAVHKRGLCCHAVSVRLSVTFVDQVKTNKHIFEIFSPYGSHTIRFFSVPNRVALFQREPP